MRSSQGNSNHHLEMLILPLLTDWGLLSLPMVRRAEKKKKGKKHSDEVLSPSLQAYFLQPPVMIPLYIHIIHSLYVHMSNNDRPIILPYFEIFE